MKDRDVKLVFVSLITFILLFSTISFVFAQSGSVEEDTAFGGGDATYNSGLSSAPVTTDLDRKVVSAYANSPILKGMSFYVLGLKDLSDTANQNKYGAATILIIFTLVWLILFVTFADVLVGFGAFSNAAVGWIVAGAITVIAANLKLIQIIAINLIKFTALFGTLAVFIGILSAFVAFVAISLGGGKLAQWALNRRINISAHQGINKIVTGAKTLSALGGTVTTAGSGAGWWIPLALAGILIAIVVGLIWIFG